MSLWEQFEMDPVVEVEGIIVDYGTEKFRIARAGGANKKFLKAIQQTNRKYRKQLEHDLMEDELAEQIMREVYAKTIVLGWEGVTDRDGEPMEFSLENCIKLFVALPELYNDLREMATKADLFRLHIQEGESGN